jgi:hypothetical protein
MLVARAARLAVPSRPVPSRPVPSTTREEPAIIDLSFALESRFRPFQLLADGAAEVEASRAGELDVAAAAPVAPFCTVEAEVDRPSGPVVLGLATDDGDHLLAFYDPHRRRAGIEVRAGGRTRVVRRTRVELPASFRFAFVLCETRVTVLAEVAGTWQPLLTERRRVRGAVDLRVPETLAAHRYAWGVRTAKDRRETDSGAEHRGGLGRVRYGLFGMAGLRDLHLVQESDGTAYVREGKAYLTATCAGLGFFQQAHWGVFTLDLERPTRLEQVAHLFARRDGLVLGDHAGQVVRDPHTGRWIVATSSWGDFARDGVHVRHLVTADDVLHGVHLLETAPSALPTTVSAWDPGITLIDGAWHVSFVESPSQKPFDFHPALAAGPRGATRWDEGLELVGAATDLHQCEGPVLARNDGRWYLLASDGDAREYPVFDLAMRRVGRLDAPYGTNIPHPQLVGLDDGSWLMVTFDGTQYAEPVLGYGGHGDVLVMRSRS